MLTLTRRRPRRAPKEPTTMKLFSPRRFGVVLAVAAALVPLGTAGAGAAAPADTASPVRAAASTLSVPDLDDVRGNLTLPTGGAGGTTVSWTSSAPSVITPTGEVNRPPTGGKPANVVLTAKVSLGRESTTRRFAATVVPKPAP